ncbi:hypothetical protein MJ575_01265 [Klebsiella pneumoniae]|nr:hypothetical protein MJ575_01265 [Klebsiella pneumoniae]
MRLIFVDPPRSELDNEDGKNGASLSAYFVHFVQPGNAVSQHLETLSQTHNVTRLALFDQFVYHHMECGVLLTRK